MMTITSVQSSGRFSIFSYKMKKKRLKFQENKQRPHQQISFAFFRFQFLVVLTRKEKVVK